MINPWAQDRNVLKSMGDFLDTFSKTNLGIWWNTFACVGNIFLEPEFAASASCMNWSDFSRRRFVSSSYWNWTTTKSRNWGAGEHRGSILVSNPKPRVWFSEYCWDSTTALVREKWAEAWKCWLNAAITGSKTVLQKSLVATLMLMILTVLWWES